MCFTPLTVSRQNKCHIILNNVRRVCPVWFIKWLYYTYAAKHKSTLNHFGWSFTAAKPPTLNYMQMRSVTRQRQSGDCILKSRAAAETVDSRSHLPTFWQETFKTADGSRVVWPLRNYSKMWLKLRLCSLYRELTRWCKRERAGHQLKCLNNFKCTFHEPRQRKSL